MIKVLVSLTFEGMVDRISDFQRLHPIKDCCGDIKKEDGYYYIIVKY